MDIFEIGTKVRNIHSGEIGRVVAIRNGRATGLRIYSVNVYKANNIGHEGNPSWGFWYPQEMEAVDD